jgi:uncharacterized repeat protein (TIGR03803 family)
MEGLESRLLLTTTYTFVPGYSFTGGSDGLSPIALVADGSGDVYGATFLGAQHGRGTIFKLGAGATVPSTLSAFTGTDGVGAAPNLVVDASGNVFGTTPTGGTDSNGSIFEVSAATQTPQVIYSFLQSAGFDPSPTLTIDAQGNLFGTTISGGANGFGQVFEISAGTHSFSTLYSFSSSDGVPTSVAVDAEDDVFGVTSSGGTNGTGQIFAIVAGQHVLTPVASLPSGVGTPSITLDAQGNIFGTTETGGTSNDGTLFEYNATAHTLSTLYNFTGGADGDFPNAHLVVDAQDNIFGTTIGPTSGNGGGVVFELAQGATSLTTLHTFTGSDGSSPTYGLVAGPTGTLYGVTSNGGADSDGTLFSLTSTTTSTPTQLAFTQEPASGTVGSLGTLSVVVRDANGAVVTSDNSAVTIQIASETSAGTLGGTVTVNAVNGIATFSGLSLPTAGTYTLEATDGALAAATTSAFTLAAVPSVGTQLAFVQSPASGAAGALGTISVAVEDANGQVLTTDNSTVTLQIISGPAGAKLNGTLSANAINGVATFNTLSLGASGTYTLEATDGSLTAATSSPFAITAAASTGTHLVFVQKPTATTAGTPAAKSIVVYVEDKKNKLVTTDESIVTIAVSGKPVGGGLSSGTVSVEAVNGVATFSDLAFDVAGTYSLVVTDGVFKAVKSSAFVVSADLSTAHLVLTPPVVAAATVGTKLSGFSVTLRDQFGNLIKNNKSKVVVGVASGPAGGSVGGTVLASISSGTVAFKGVVVPTAGTYTLQVSDPTLGDTSNVPVTFTETVNLGTTAIPTIKPAKSYTFGKTISLSTTLKSTAPSTVLYSGTATITDSNGDVLGTVTVSTKGVVKATIAALAAGTYECTLNYSGDINHAAAQSTLFTLVVNPPKA